MSHPGVRIAAVMTVRNERNVIVTCLGHLLSLGVERVFVVDNGSTDDTPDLVRRVASISGRVVLVTDGGSFRQAELLTEQARQAAFDGAEWILPVDADEFLWLPRDVSLAGLCRAAGVGGYRLPVRNFVQARPVRRDWPGSLATMCVAAVPFGEMEDGHALVEARVIPFVRISYPGKLLLRATPTMQIGFGHHDATGLAGPLEPPKGGEVLHAPIRSAADLHRRVETGRRVEAVTPHPTQSWHVKRLVGMDPDELHQEWRRNSFHPLRPARPGAMRLDWRLSQLARRQAGLRRRVYGG